MKFTKIYSYFWVCIKLLNSKTYNFLSIKKNPKNNLKISKIKTSNFKRLLDVFFGLYQTYKL